MIGPRLFIALCILSFHHVLGEHRLSTNVMRTLLYLQNEVIREVDHLPSTEKLGLDCETMPIDADHNVTRCHGWSTAELVEVNGTSPDKLWYERNSIDNIRTEYFKEISTLKTRVFPTPLEIKYLLPERLVLNQPNSTHAFTMGEVKQCFVENCWKYQTMALYSHKTEIDSFDHRIFYSVVESFEENWRNSTVLFNLPFMFYEDIIVMEASEFLFDRFRTAFMGKFFEEIPFYGFRNIFFANDVFVKTWKVMTEENELTDKIEISVTIAITLKSSANEQWPIDKVDFFDSNGMPRNPRFMEFIKFFDDEEYYGFFDLVNLKFDYDGDIYNVMENYSYVDDQEYKMRNGINFNEDFYVKEMLKSFKQIRPNAKLAGLKYQHLFNFLEEFADLISHEDGGSHMMSSDQNFCTADGCGNFKDTGCTIVGCALEERHILVSFPNSCSSELNITVITVRETLIAEQSKTVANIFLGNVNYTGNWKDGHLHSFYLWDKIYAAQYRNASDDNHGSSNELIISRLNEPKMKITYSVDSYFSTIKLKLLEETTSLDFIWHYDNSNITVVLHHLDSIYLLSYVDDGQTYNITHSPNLDQLNEFSNKVVEGGLELLYNILDDLVNIWNEVGVKCIDQLPRDVLEANRKAKIDQAVHYGVVIKHVVFDLVQFVMRKFFDTSHYSIVIPRSVLYRMDWTALAEALHFSVPEYLRNYST